MKVKFRYSLKEKRYVLFLEGNEKFDVDPKDCDHSLDTIVYVEWESDYLGHGWMCMKCGKIVQYG